MYLSKQVVYTYMMLYDNDLSEEDAIAEAKNILLIRGLHSTSDVACQ